MKQISDRSGCSAASIIGISQAAATFQASSRAFSLSFSAAACAPLVRSSYFADGQAKQAGFYPI